MIRYKLSRDAKILFVGINPHPGSYSRGVPFSNNKTFWYLMNRAGLIREKESDLRRDEKLKQMYETRFKQVYHLNFINLVNRPTKEVKYLNRGEEKKGAAKLLEAIHVYHPTVICFIGKVTYSKFTGQSKVDFGWHEPINNSKAYVMHFPIRGSASIRIEEFKEINDEASQQQ
ncbi:MAG: hypothetical protein M1503_03595 [Thaumarchaeota archaeon]|nr:hypothetical protein [Nitrososphaerota archaeon]MCL5317337.1 hypothetical protein [Nitrososphaerota archaeon]